MFQVALTQAGYYLVAPQNKQQIIDAENFIAQVKVVIQESIIVNHDRLTPTSMQEILNKVSAKVPSEFQQGWLPN